MTFWDIAQRVFFIRLHEQVKLVKEGNHLNIVKENLFVCNKLVLKSQVYTSNAIISTNTNVQIAR